MITGKNSVDVVACFLTYVTFCGDIEKTAAARNLDPAFVAKLSQDENWPARIKTICRMTAEGRPGDFERAQNRALCFVQGHQVATLLDRLIHELSEKTDADLVEVLTPRNKDGSPGPISAKVFADLTAAMEKCHFLKYIALGDSVKEREQRAEEDGASVSANALHSAVINALNGCKQPLKAETLLVEAADSTVKRLAAPQT